MRNENDNYTNTLNSCTITLNTHAARNAAQMNIDQKTVNSIVWTNGRRTQVNIEILIDFN
jgi:hypothetical protein